MQYFTLLNTINDNITGVVPQVKEVIHNCNVSDDPNFIDRFAFKKIQIKPTLSNVVLDSNSKLTDLISITGIGFSYGSTVISTKLKYILDDFNCFGLQFYPTYVMYRNKKNEDYWQTHFYQIPFDLIDFESSDILLKDRGSNRKLTKKYLKRMSKEEFLTAAESCSYPKMIFLKNIVFKETMKYDYFFLRNFEEPCLGIVSETLKNEIEKQKISGVEFKPWELSLNEWYSSKG